MQILDTVWTEDQERLGMSAEDLPKERSPRGDDESPTVFTGGRKKDNTSDGGSVCIRLRSWLWGWLSTMQDR